jgi:glycosyltransferase involved in cell wall biosynthesis/CDP-glycerol glycerophosphotransferase (TagB/SpsB family)
LWDERVALDGQRLRITIAADEQFTEAELTDGQASTAKSPLFRSADGQTGSFDLTSVPAGRYRIVLRSPTGAVTFGRVLPTRHQAFAAVVKADRSRPQYLKLSQSTFAQGRLAWACIDLRRGELFLRISQTDDIDAHLAAEEASRPRPAAELKFTIISPVYQVEKYLDDFFRSVVGQTIDFRSSIDLIMVDDGSTDNSAKIVKRWQRKFPDNIRYLHQANGGPGSARNRGIDLATRPWITFIDPDNFIDEKYFERVGDAIRSYDDLAMVSCNVITFDEQRRAKLDDHPLRFRFATGELLLPATQLGRNLQLNTSSAFFRTEIIAAHSLRFDERIRPGFEDAHFDARYLLAAGERPVLFLASAVHYSRRRSDKSSLKQTGPLDPRRYDAQVRHGYLDLLRYAKDKCGTVPVQIQHTVLYSLHWQIEQIVERPESVQFLTDDQKRTYIDLLRQVFAYLDVQAIENYDIAGMSPRHKVGLLAFFKDAAPARQTVEARRLDRQRRLLELVFWSARRQPDDEVRIDGKRIEAAFRKARRLDFLGADFAWEHIRWIGIEEPGAVQLLIAGGERQITANGTDCGRAPSFTLLRQRLTPTPPAGPELPEVVRRLRRAAVEPETVRTYRNGWLFIDRDNAADDSAEFMYRYVSTHRPDLNAFFILQRTSPHWRRMEREGARLIAFAEDAHALALLNADHLVSSHASHFVLDHLPRRYFGDMLKYRFTYLRHGVSKDINDWLNAAEIDCLISSAPAEYQAISGDGSEYRYCEREVALTGLARHDMLLERAGAPDDKVIVLMPTWRRSLTGMALGPGNRRSTAEAFYHSEFARRWKALLHSPRLAAMARRHAHTVVFFLHDNLEQYRQHFEAPAHVAVRTFGDGGPVQPLFAGLSLFVTDYSSKAFDVALLRRRILYYQFDPETFFGGHTARPGYFDYARDGFGPIHDDQEALLDDIEKAIGGGRFDPVFMQRAERFFPFRDGRNRERILQAILKSAEPLPRRESQEAAAGT